MNRLHVECSNNFFTKSARLKGTVIEFVKPNLPRLSAEFSSTDSPPETEILLICSFIYCLPVNFERLLLRKPLVDTESRLFMNSSHESIEERYRERCISIIWAVDHSAVDQRISGRTQLLG